VTLDATTPYAMKRTGPFEERLRFVETCRDSDESFGAICEQFGISRQKGYKWLGRFEEGGLEGLVDRSRRPHSNSRRWRGAALSPLGAVGSSVPFGFATAQDGSSAARAGVLSGRLRRSWSALAPLSVATAAPVPPVRSNNHDR
jgi:hypothetical protein